VFTLYAVILPPNQIACNNTNFCQGSQPDSIYETQTTNISGLVYQWQWNNNGTWVNITGANHPNYLPPDSLGAITYRRVISLNSCTSNSNEITITSHQQPSISYSLAESDTLCLIPNLHVHILAHLTGTSPWHISYSVNGTDYSFYQIQSDTTYQVSINQSYTWIAVNQLTDTGGCTAALNTDTIKIWGYSPVNAQATSMELCGLNATLQATSSAQGVGIWYLPAGITTTDIHNPHAQITASSYGSYALVWEVSNGPCRDTAQISVVFYQSPQPPDAGIDVTLDQISPVLLQATAANVGTGTWSVVQGNAVFTNIHAPNATASGFDEGNNILRWTIVNGVCPAVYDDITVTLRTLIVPEGFSPNGDNINDMFVIKGLDISKEYNLIVFNRWGNVVYEKKPYDNTWDGKDKQQNQLPDDTYFYMLKMNDKVYKNGYVVLKR
jgi:gliding motility-associated-like protein